MRLSRVRKKERRKRRGPEFVGGTAWTPNSPRDFPLEGRSLRLKVTKTELPVAFLDQYSGSHLPIAYHPDAKYINGNPTFQCVSHVPKESSTVSLFSYSLLDSDGLSTFHQSLRLPSLIGRVISSRSKATKTET